MTIQRDILSRFFEIQAGEIKQYGKRAAVPFWLLAFALVGGFVAWAVPARFFGDNPDFTGGRIALFAAVLTFNALMLALCWSSFAKIFEALQAPGFGAYVRQKNMLEMYEFYVDFIHYLQVIAAAVALVGLFIAIWAASDFPPWLGYLGRISIAMTIASSLYAMRYAVGSVRLMRDLVRLRLDYETWRGDGANGSQLKVVPGSVRRDEA